MIPIKVYINRLIVIISIFFIIVFIASCSYNTVSRKDSNGLVVKNRTSQQYNKIDGNKVKRRDAIRNKRFHNRKKIKNRYKD